MDETKNRSKEKKEPYEYNEYPKNVRQIGIPLPGIKVYLEDYVITYLKQCFVQPLENKIAVLIGKRGEDAAREGIFIYGAVETAEDGALERGSISSGTWDKVHELIHKNFPGAQVLGWACGAALWNSQVESQVRSLHKKEFRTENQVLFLWDLNEKEEKIFLWQKKILRELPGYYVYFSKNPQMQDFMLNMNKEERVEAAYQDDVTKSIRHVLAEKEEHKRNLQLLTYCGILAAGIAMVFGVHALFDSTARLQKMEKTVSRLSAYVEQQREDVEVMSRRAQNVVRQIPFEGSTATGSAAGKTKAVKSSVKPKDAKAAAKSEDAKAASKPETDMSESKKSTKPSGRGDEKQTAAGSASAGSKKTSKETEGTDKKTAQTAAVKGKLQSYVVQSGDTLSQIVWRQYHDLSYEKKVKKVNHIKNSDEIYEGQRILLPGYTKK